MNFTNNRTVSLKKMMALAGLFWFFFLIFYLLGALTFHCGEQALLHFMSGLMAQFFILFWLLY